MRHFAKLALLSTTTIVLFAGSSRAALTVPNGINEPPAPSDVVAADTSTATNSYQGPGEPSAVVPEPTTLLSGAFLVIPFGATAIRLFRTSAKRQTRN